MHVVDFVHPFLCRMMRCMRRAGNVVAEESFVRIDLIDTAQPINRIIRHAGNKIPSGMTLERVNLGSVTKQVWLPLISITADETIEIFETRADWPLIEWSDPTSRECRHVVIFSKPRCGITVVSKNAADRRFILSDNAVVSWKTCRLLRNHPKAR